MRTPSHVEQKILALISDRQPEAIEIRKQWKEVFDEEVSVGTFYTQLKRMMQKGWVETVALVNAKDRVVVGKGYALTKEGRKVLDQTLTFFRLVLDLYA